VTTTNLPEPALTPNAADIMAKRYQRKDGQGGVSETPGQTIDRVVTNVASVNALYAEPDDGQFRGDGSISWSEEFPRRTAMRQHSWLQRERGTDVEWCEYVGPRWYAAEAKAEEYRVLLNELWFLPNSPTWTGAGTPLGQLAACFVLPIDDDLASGRASIFETMKVAAAIQQTGGGNGFSFGRLRPNKALVTRSMGKASGPVGFLITYDGAFGWIGQGGTRRGANMGVLPVHHPDVLEFIRAKTVEGEISNFNISVAITDDFMEAVEKDADFTLRWALHGETDDPVDYEVSKTVRARDLFDEITRSAWVIGDPGCLFIDAANRTNPVPRRYTLEATNPCGEQWLGPYENCCLGSINLSKFAHWSATGEPDRWNPTFDWESLRKAIRLSVDFLDDVVDANQYVPVVPELEAAAQGGRRIGLGGMGLADAMAIMGIRYGTGEGNEFASQVNEYITYHAYLRSKERAQARGTFGWFEGSIYDFKSNEFGTDILGHDGAMHEMWAPPTPLVQHVTDFGRPSLDWGWLFEEIKAHGLRNSCLLTWAPTGTISNVAGCEASGCEPFFALAYLRMLLQDEERVELVYGNALFEEALRRHGFHQNAIAEILEQVKANSGSCQGLEAVPYAVRHAFPVAADIAPLEHVTMQAVLQRWVDNSISKTINLPFTATVEDVQEAYQKAWEMGCKGITVYRQGSREVEVLSTGSKAQEQATPDWPIVAMHRLPAYAETEGIPTRTFPVPTPFGTAQVYLTELKEHPDRPFDLRIGFGKAGNDKMADVEALGRMISVGLRSGVPVDTIVEQLQGIGGATFVGFGERRVRSVADGIAKLLRRIYMPTSSLPQPVVEAAEAEAAPQSVLVADPTKVCPKCHQATLIWESGCSHCDTRLGGCGEYEGCE
jgi:ribonucleoside-diphosphate reductase alpha chain